LQALAGEICVAMDAITTNQLVTFKESVANQEMLCASLETLVHSVSHGFPVTEQHLLSSIDPSVALKIQAASGALHELNLQYAALLKHSGRTIALLASLCRSHTGEFQEARGPRSKHQTWSCEM
jgi:hypothetical protein